VERGVAVDPARVSSLDGFGAVVNALQLGCLFAVAVVLISWMFVARSNSEAYLPGEFRRSKGWTIGGWFVPVIWFLFPYQCMKDVHAASDPRRPVGYPAKTFSTAGSRLLAWWSLWWISILVNRGAIVLYGSAETGDDMRTSFTMDYIVTALELSSAALLASIVLKVTAWQRDRYVAARQWQAAQNQWGWESH
jgi:hypothetical protein